MHTRFALEQDIPKIVEIGKILMEEHYTRDPDYYQLESNFDSEFSYWVRNQLNSQFQFILLAVDDTENISGFISGFIKSLFPWFKIKSVGHISYLMVLPQYQKQGIGKILEQEAVNWFKSKNMDFVELYVNEDNPVGCHAWEKFGFKPFKKFLRKRI